MLALLLTALPVWAAPGALDTSFAGTGVALTDFGGFDQGKAVGIQSDGKIVAAGHSRGKFAVSRYHPNGDLDLSFGRNGKVITRLSGQAQSFFLVVQSDDRFVVGGGARGDFALVRYLKDGALDLGYGSGGKVLTDFGGSDDQIRSMALQQDGMIVAAGFSNASGTYDFALARYNTSGALDSGFGTGGKLVMDIGGVDQAKGIAVQNDGYIVAVGRTDIGRNFDFAVARYAPDGSLDPSFGVGGLAITDFGSADLAKAVAIQADGKIVAAGEASNNLALARYDTTGALDPSFDQDGRVVTFIGQSDFVFALKVLADSRIVAAGYSNASGTFDFTLARYETNGSLDPSFGVGGIVLSDFGGHDEIRAIAVQSDGKIVAAGFSDAAGSFDFAVARYDVE